MCSKVFITKKIRLESHFAKEHNRSKTRKFQCDNCGKSFNSKENYNLHATIHMKKIHDNQICQVCSKSFITVDDLLVNMEEAHKDTNLQSSSHFDKTFKLF